MLCWEFWEIKQTVKSVGAFSGFNLYYGISSISKTRLFDGTKMTKNQQLPRGISPSEEDEGSGGSTLVY